MKIDKKYIFVAILWLIMLIGLDINQRLLQKNAKIVYFKTLPVDPRDLFRGDYVILNYEFSSVNGYSVPDLKKGASCYVSLAEGEETGYYDVLSVSRKQPKDGLYIKGRIISKYANTLNLKYGIESFFVAEGKGKELERLRDDSKLYAKVALNSQGGAKLISVTPFITEQ